jgi:hypothetical protein
MTSENWDDPDDPLMPLLAARETIPDSSPQRAKVLEHTLSVVRRRRHWRQVRGAMAYAAVFVLGWTFANCLPVRTNASGVATSTPTPSTADTTPALVEATTSPAMEPKPPQPTKHVVRPTEYESFRQRGDKAADQPGQLVAAVHSYSRAVSLASKDQRAIDPGNDNWLLMALKLNQNSEKQDAED